MTVNIPTPSELGFTVHKEKGGGGSTEVFEINLLRTWDVYIESRISPKSAAYAPLFGFCWMVKALSVQFMAGFGNFRPEGNYQCVDFDHFTL